MKPKSDFSFGGSYNDLLVQWIKGTDLKDLVSEFGNQVESTEELGKIIDVLFRYHLPWGISAYIRITKKVLNLDNTELPDKIKFLPSMVKFGLPDPMACWVMSVGIPFRKTAIEIAAAFRDEVQEPNYYKFLQWLNNLDSERLHSDFGLTDIILEDVSRTISFTGINPLMRDFTGLDNFLPREVAVKGITYQNRSVVALSAQIGQRVELVRDYDNEIDRNAIVVHLSGREMGYIPRDVAQVLAPEIDTGANLGATIVSLTKGKFPKISVRVIQNL